MSLFSDDPNSMYTYDANLVIFDNEPKIVLSVPIKNPSTTLNLYKFLNRPILYRNKNANFEIMLRNVPEFLIINDHKTLYKTLTHKEFSECQKLSKNNYYTCRYDNIYRKDIDNTCLTRIFSGNVGHLSEHCELTYDVAREYVVQVGVNEYEIEPLDIPVSVDIICNNKTLNRVGGKNCISHFNIP